MPLLRLAAQDVAPFVRLRNQTMELDIAYYLGKVAIDAEKVRDSVNHLLLNAVKFTPDGGRIDLKATRSEKGLAISVSDTGAGIQPEHLPRIFETFLQGLTFPGIPRTIRVPETRNRIGAERASRYLLKCRAGKWTW